MAIRNQIIVRGIVQGVGFRPFIYGLAIKYALKGQVLNNGGGVLIDVEGDLTSITALIHDIKTDAPTLAQIDSIERYQQLPLINFSDFTIVESSLEDERFMPISPDIATCADCLQELMNPQDRRYRYAFINCTNCGPRFTIIENIPYDRAQTTMRDFPMCAICQAEYQDPLDRRYHAEPTACAICGPRLYLTDHNGKEVYFDRSEGTDEISHTQQMLQQGKIIAIKGLGGFHLVCDALNSNAIAQLRSRKYRSDKPFALMAKDIEMIKQYCLVSTTEIALLHSINRPIVLLEKRSDISISSAIADGVNNLGFMLPYTPLHHLLLADYAHPLVMTSGNISDEPICYQDREAITRLNRIADLFLWHNRRIHMRTDDSVTRVYNEKEMILRRSRGYAPAPLKMSQPFKYQILACGAELKNTFCLTRDNYAFISHHIGDLENLETLQSFTNGIEHYQKLFHIEPELIAYDLHPEYLSSKYALALSDRIDKIVDKIGIQHHHAHIASCLADNNIEGEVIGVAMDGLGFGEDSHFWGGEFFVADFAQAERIAHLDYIPMPGGAKAIREPWRMAATYLQRALGDDFLNLKLPFVKDLSRPTWNALRSMIVSGTNCPQTSSMGRLFDALSCLLGLRQTINYEGQAAIELEAIADKHDNHYYDFEIDEQGIIKATPVIEQVINDLLNEVSPARVSARFHWSVAHLITKVAYKIGRERHLNRVALSGGVFQNILLLGQTCQLLQAAGFQVFTHRRVPTNDGGISLGQAMIANARWH